MSRKQWAFVFAAFLPVLLARSALSQNSELLKAIDYGSLEELALAIKRGADPKARDEHGRPAILVAAERGDTQIVGMLLTYGAEPNDKIMKSVILMPSKQRFEKGRTALMEAAARGHGDSVQLLLAAGAAPDEVDSAGLTATDLAERGGFYDLARLIRSYDGDRAVELPCELHGFGADSASGEQTLFLPVGVERAKELLEDSMIAYGFVLRKDEGERITGLRLLPHFAINMAARSNNPGEKFLASLASLGPAETKVVASTKSPPLGRQNRQWTTAVLQHARCLYKLLDDRESFKADAVNDSGALVLKDGIPIRLRLRRHLLSRTAEIGQPVEFQVATDVLVNGEIVIKKGTRVQGRVTEAKAGKGFGRRAALSFTVDLLATTDGSSIPLRSSGESIRGGDGGNRMAAAILTAGVLGAWLQKGEDVLIRAGSEYSAFVAGDHELGVLQ